jgi:hypothetical protein
MTINKQIYAHRGLWAESVQNSMESIKAAARIGFSIETDLRDVGNSVVISHDPAPTAPLIFFSDLLSVDTKFALNIKSDGLISLLPDIRNVGFDYFFFDGSIPELYKYRSAGFQTALRLSEFERELPWNTGVIWLDAFRTDWWIDTSLLQKYSEVCEVVVVSPELHGRDKSRVWDLVLEEMRTGNTNVSICTDFPEKFEANL